jgi:hypothetical protein
MCNLRAWGLGFGLAVNGLAMLALPSGWYAIMRARRRLAPSTPISSAIAQSVKCKVGRSA